MLSPQIYESCTLPLLHGTPQQDGGLLARDPQTMDLDSSGPSLATPRMQFFWKKSLFQKGAKLIGVFLDFFSKSVSKYFFVRRFKRPIDPLGKSLKSTFFHFFKKVFHSPPKIDLKIFYSESWLYSEPLNIADFWKKSHFFLKNKIDSIPHLKSLFFQKYPKFLGDFQKWVKILDSGWSPSSARSSILLRGPMEQRQGPDFMDLGWERYFQGLDSYLEGLNTLSNN